jgi:serine phosphatase RsbU (regulator of sigma subunit)
VAHLLHYQTYRITGSLGLAALLFSFGYVAVQIALAGERRLLSIEGELVIAREIQASILPSNQPGDRFLLYTDGVSEPENRSGEAFGAQA